ncbi:MAG TPA: hypothetical protein VF665_01200, partial [Longimicrobium sp.]
MLLLVLFIWMSRSTALLAIAPAGDGPALQFPDAGGGGGGGGGGGDEVVSYIDIAPPAPAPVPETPPVVVPEDEALIPPQPTPPPVPTPPVEQPRAEARPAAP